MVAQFPLTHGIVGATTGDLAVSVDGSCILDWNQSNLNDSPYATFSFWIKKDAPPPPGTEQIVFSSGTPPNSRQAVSVLQTGRVNFQLRCVGPYIYNDTSNVSVCDGNWHHVLCSVSLAAGQLFASIYVDDANPATTTPNQDVFDWSPPGAPEQRVFADLPDISTFAGELFQLWISSEDAWDMTTEANRRKFINADLTHVDLGATGQNPSGATPFFFFNSPAQWHTNLGKANGFNLTGTYQYVGGPP